MNKKSFTEISSLSSAKERYYSTLNNILTHPFFMGLIICLVLFALFQPDIEKYEIIQIEEVDSRNQHYYYSDFNSDGHSEFVSIDSSGSKIVKIMYHDELKIIDQYNCNHSLTGGRYCYSGDYNADGLEEFFLFTQNRDSVFLNVLTPGKKQASLVKDRFITKKYKVESYDNNTEIVWGTLIENENGTKDFYFAVNSGFSLQPRNVFRYIIDTDSLLSSPKSFASLRFFDTMDLNHDSNSEIYIATSATGNADKDVPYSDQYCWLMTLNTRLEFFYEPLKFGKYPANCYAQPLVLHKNNQLVIFYEHFGLQDDSSALVKINNKGVITGRKNLNPADYISCITLGHLMEKPENIYLFHRKKGVIYVFNSNLEKMEEISFHPAGVIDYTPTCDLDGNGRQEIILGSVTKGMIISDESFRHYAVYNYPEGQEAVDISIIQHNKNRLIYIQFMDYGHILEWKVSPVYTFRFIILLFAYLCISLIIYGIFRIQHYRVNTILERERRITSLQLLSIKNQIDPHFTFNVINAMGSLYESNSNREEAYTIFVKYAGFLRQMVLHSDKIHSTIDDEIKFVDSYLSIEKMRKGDSFEYCIDIDNKVDRTFKIPRLLIFTFVENAVKYGLHLGKNKDPRIAIDIIDTPVNIKIIIQNSGPGLGQIPNEKKGTGKGLKILKEIIALYKKIENKEISFQLKDKVSKAGEIEGVMAEIGIRKN